MLFNPYAPSIDLLELPAMAIAKSGQQFDPREDVWVLDRLRMTFADLYEYCTNNVVVALKLTLIQNEKQLALTTVINRLSIFKNFVRSVILPGSDSKMSSISIIHIMNFRGTLSVNEDHLLNIVRGLFKSWDELGYPGIDDGVIQLLKKTKLKRRQKVLPSPLCEVDQVNFENKLHAAYQTAKISTRKYVLAWLGLTFAPRPSQLANMKIKDLVVEYIPGGGKKYTLKVPRAKQRDQRSRDEFTDREPHEEGLGALLHAWTMLVIDEYHNIGSDHDTDPQDLPMFPKWKAKMNEPGMKFHPEAHKLIHELDSLAKQLNVQSIETGKNLDVGWGILRDTLATRLTEEGKSAEQIALWLDHTSIRNVMHYAGLTTKFKKKLDERLTFELAPIAQAFMGFIISDKSEVSYDTNRNPRLRNPTGDSELGDVGLCGKYGFCSGAMAPIACYTCSQFRAWLHGPHMEVLLLLIARREQILNDTNGDERIADSLNNSILACGQVIHECEKMLKGVD
jgi:integrase